MKKLFNFARQYRNWLITIIVLGAVIYSIINRRLSTPPATVLERSPVATVFRTPPNQTTTSLASPSPEGSALTNAQVIIAQPILFPELDIKTQTLYYLDPIDNLLKKRHLVDGSTETVGNLSSYTNFAVWSPNHEQLLIYFTNQQGNRIENPLFQDNLPYGDTIVAKYNIKSKGLDRLNENISTLSWLGNDKIIYQYQSGLINNLVIAQSDGNKWKNISSLIGDAEIITVGNYALVQIQGQNKVTRYGLDGLKKDTITVPTDFKLANSDWDEDGKSFIYWTVNNEIVNLYRLEKDGTIAQVTSFKTQQEDFTILWDNIKGDIYLASFDGLYRLEAKVTQ